MSDFKIESDRKYTQDHEWARPEGADVVVGITSYAVDQLGDVTLVNFDVKVGDEIAAGKQFGTIESVKTVSELYAPVGGKVTRVNADLDTKPELVNDDCYGKAWMIAIAPSDPNATSGLLAADAYGELLKKL
jgi:glycine cleavage system H protein